MNRRYNQKDEYHIRYHIYRELGYNSRDARILRSRSNLLDVSDIRLDKNREIVRNRAYYDTLNKVRAQDIVIKDTRSKNEIRRIRYALLREAGYSPQEASRLRSRPIDVRDIELDRNGKIKKGLNYKRKSISIVVDLDVNYFRGLENNTVYSQFGMITQDKRYKDKTMKVVHAIQRDTGANEKQSFYLLWFMFESGMSYEEAKRELLSSKKWEIYATKQGSVKF
jgi:hypothetical protein